MDIKNFKNPPVIMRPTPFWAINERILPDEAARQMADMLSVGLGGGFFHSRHGLITSYLGKEWFDAMGSAITAAKKKDGYLWLYDEDLWPSGNAGGMVAGTKDEYRAAFLKPVLVDAGQAAPSECGDSKLQYAYILQERKGLTLEKFRPVPLREIDSYIDFERLILYREYSAKTAWWSGQSYVNLLNPEAVKKFIELTHEVYYKKLGKEFGKRVPGIFTDEPHIFHPVGIAWYDGLPSLYKKWMGRNFKKDLPYLFFDGEFSGHVRLLIHRTILRQFVESYSKPLYDWCERHNIAYTGHYNQEENFAKQITNHCGSVMAHYRYMHIPGIDHLCRQVEDMLFTCRQASSAARQTGKQDVLTELFGVSRHTSTFQDFKWLGDYNLVHGVNFFCPHLSWYSAKGRRKRDYPPVWNYQQTYWRDLPVLNDYFTRLSYMLTSGRADASILLLNSIESGIVSRRIGVVSKGKRSGIPENDLSVADELDRLMRRTLETILNSGYECDIGEEGLISEIGSVKGLVFNVGRMSYRTVVMPPSRSWRETTFKLVESFVLNGGTLIVLGRTPTEIDGLAAEERWKTLLAHKNVYQDACSAEAVRNLIRTLVISGYTLTGTGGGSYGQTYLHHRKRGDDEIFFIVNSDREDRREYLLTIERPGRKRLFRWEPLDGSVSNVKTESGKDGLIYRFYLEPAGSLLLSLSSSVRGAADEDFYDIRDAQSLRLPSPFDFKRLDDNVLVLDRISPSYDGANFEKEKQDWVVRREIANRFGTEETLQWQPWVASEEKIFKGKGGEVVLRYSFSSLLNKPKSFIVIEDMDKGAVYVNGSRILTKGKNSQNWHWDRGFIKAEITEFVKKGENTVDFKVHYDFLTEVESAYIVGDFGVEMETPSRGRIVKERKKINTGSLTGQGYPFYSGKMAYISEFNPLGFQRVFIKLINPSATLFNVRINGREAGKILWSPYIVEITSYIKKNAKNVLEVELVSSLQNSWGPLHEQEGDDNMIVCPPAFEEGNKGWSRASNSIEAFSFFNYGIDGIELLFL